VPTVETCPSGVPSLTSPTRDPHRSAVRVRRADQRLGVGRFGVGTLSSSEGFAALLIGESALMLGKLKLAEPVERPRGGVVACGGTFVSLCGLHKCGVTPSAFFVRVTRHHRYRLPVDTVAPPTGLRTPAPTRRSVIQLALTTRFTPGANGRRV